jgi:Domain of unknown function (DUF4149)
VVLNFSRLILLACWFGAALFFSIVVAPAAFGVLRSFDLPNANEIAGTIVTRSLSVVNVAGFLIGLFLLASLFVQRVSRRSTAVVVIECACLGIIVLTTGIGHWVITMRMRALRVAMYLPIDQVPLDDPRRVAFQNLHGYSVTGLGLAMIAALIAVVLMARSLRS